ncbi:hypothetical protein IWX47DRAFT_860252, partial [Phyllosticta citricarpa]
FFFFFFHFFFTFLPLFLLDREICGNLAFKRTRFGNGKDRSYWMGIPVVCMGRMRHNGLHSEGFGTGPGKRRRQVN